jgi:multisubunit Na+/H+ antiporter MnhE subunit
MDSRRLRDMGLAFLEFLFLLLLWMIFVSELRWHELEIGIAAALLATIGNWVVTEEGLAAFRPRARWVLLGLWEPWYVVKGMVVVFRELWRTFTGVQPEGRFKAVAYQYGGADPMSTAKRALFAVYVTVSPDTIVVGLDRDQQIALLHQVGPEEISELARRLGAEE